MLVIGFLIAIALGLYAIARMVAADTQEKYVLADKQMVTAVNERLNPVAKVAVAGKDNSAMEPAKPVAAAAPQGDLTGEMVYNQACITCHGAGIGGAPKFKDKAQWGPRIAKGVDILHQHALQGFQGQAGVMPPKGGRTDFSDKSIINGVDYMVGAAK